LIIGAWVILNTINPKILNLNQNLSLPPGTGLGSVVPGVPMTQEQIDASNAVREILRTSNPSKPIGVNSGPCVDGRTTGCTNLNGLPQSAVDGLSRLNDACGPLCFITVTGGTEGGHQTHGVGNAIVDLSKTRPLSEWVTHNSDGSLNTPTVNSAGRLYTKVIGGQTVTFLEETNRPAHWHVVFR
jgi:hypothetical protein